MEQRVQNENSYIYGQLICATRVPRKFNRESIFCTSCGTVRYSNVKSKKANNCLDPTLRHTQVLTQNGSQTPKFKTYNSRRKTQEKS